jgi:hypothetical protein
MTFIELNVIRHHTTGKTMIDHFEIFNMVLIFFHHHCGNGHQNGYGYHNGHAILSAKTILRPSIAYSLSHSSSSEESWHHRRAALQHILV